MRRARALLGILTAGVVAACGAGGDDDGAESGDDAITAGPVDSTLDGVDALKYEIDLAVADTPGKETFRATVKGTYAATADLTELALDFDGNVVDKVTVSGRAAVHTRDKSRLVVKLPAPVAKGRTFSAEIAYHGDVRQADGANPDDFAAFGGFMVKQKNADKKRIYSSLSWPSKARRWLPLRDHPRDSAAVAITATFPKAFTVLANGARLGAAENADGTKTWRYEETAPMPAYAIHVAAYEDWKTDDAKGGDGSPIATFTYGSGHPKAKSIFGDVPKVLDFYQATYGKYRWGSLTYIEEPIFGGGMEHASVISMDETLFPDEAQARSTSFHELGHHWSGNSVHFRTWNDFWLSEGFTEFLMAKAITHVDGAEAGKAVWRDFMTSLIAADKENPHPLAPPGAEIDVLTIFDDIPYEKGALTVRMLEHLVGEPTMTAFLKGWFDRHGLAAAVTTDDLQHELAAASGKDLGSFFATMVREGGHPELKASFKVVGNVTEIEIDQIQDKGPKGGFLFPIDVDLVDEAGHAERVTVDLTAKKTTKRLTPKNPVKSLVVDPDEFAVAVSTCGQSGGSCKDGYRCAPQRASVSVCVPGPDAPAKKKRR